MKRLFKSSLKAIGLTILLSIFFVSCVKEKGTPPELPPYETMVVDFSQFSKSEKSMKSNLDYNEIEVIDSTYNWTQASGSIGLWSLLLTATMIVPTTAYYAAFTQKPEYIEENVWQWSYDVTGFASSYTARLVGTVGESSVKWEMYLTKYGVGAFQEFMWFEGTSNINGTGGEWTLYHSAEFPEEVITIDWERSGEEVAQVVYSFVRELNDNRQADPFNGSSLTYGKKQGDLDGYFDAHYYDIWTAQFVDVNIEWSLDGYYGHIKFPKKFNDNEWHCWDAQGYDIICE